MNETTLTNRLLHNADCNAMFYDPSHWQPEGGPYSARAIQRYVDMAADTGFDTFVCNPNCQAPLYPSRALRSKFDGFERGDAGFFKNAAGEPNPRAAAFYEPYLDLLDAGVDWLAETAAACRRRGMAPWLSIRMNDLHQGDHPGHPMNCHLLRDPAYRLSDRMPNPNAAPGHPKRLRGLNYETSEVRDYMFTLIREVVEEYDFEGLELDWLRRPICCNPNPSPETLETITAWHASLRELTLAKAARTGRPYRFGLRVLGHLGRMRSVGIDVAAMTQRGLLDFVTAGNIHQASWETPFDILREQVGDRIALFGVLNTTFNRLYCFDPQTGIRCRRRLHTSPEAVRGNAAGKRILGADGLVTFNCFFNPDTTRPADREYAYLQTLRETNDLATLRQQPKFYTFSTMTDNQAILPNEDIVEQLPTLIRPRWRREFRLPMIREARAGERALRVQLVVERQEELLEIGLSFNGCWPDFSGRETDRLLAPAVSYGSGKKNNHVGGEILLTHHLPEYRVFEYEFPAAGIGDGWNDFTVYYGGAEPLHDPGREIQCPPLCLVSMEMRVTE